MLARYAFDMNLARDDRLALEAPRCSIDDRCIDLQHPRESALAAEARDLKIAPDDAIGGFAFRQRAALLQRLGPSMLQCVPYVGERLGAFLDLEREEPGLQVLHRAIELRAMLGLRISAGELERHRLRCAALRERIHHQLRAMTQKPALIKFRIATRLDAQAQERAHHVARDETRSEE